MSGFDLMEASDPNTPFETDVSHALYIETVGISPSTKDWAGDLRLRFELIARGCFQGFVKKLRNSQICCMREIDCLFRVQSCSILRWTTNPILDVAFGTVGSTIVNM